MKNKDSINHVAVRRVIARTYSGVRSRSINRISKRNLANSAKSTKSFPNYSKKNYKSKKRISAKVKNSVLPRRDNNYRPYLIRRAGLILMAICLVVLNFVVIFWQNQEVLGEKTDIIGANLLSETNSARAKQNLPNLKENLQLNVAAENKARDMLTENYWAHDSPTGNTPWKFISEAGYEYALAGENLARGFTSTEDIMKAWLASPSHRANILEKKYTEVGFAVVTGQMDDKETILVVAEYGRPANNTVSFGGATSNPDLSSESEFGGEIIGAKTSVGILEKNNFLTHFVTGLRNFAPPLILSLAALAIIAIVIIIAHLLHWHLSPRLIKTWRLHNALIKICFIAILAVGVIISYGGGLI